MLMKTELSSCVSASFAPPSSSPPSSSQSASRNGRKTTIAVMSSRYGASKRFLPRSPPARVGARVGGVRLRADDLDRLLARDKLTVDDDDETVAVASVVRGGRQRELLDLGVGITPVLALAVADAPRHPEADAAGGPHARRAPVGAGLGERYRTRRSARARPAGRLVVVWKRWWGGGWRWLGVGCGWRRGWREGRGEGAGGGGRRGALTAHSSRRTRRPSSRRGLASRPGTRPARRCRACTRRSTWCCTSCGLAERAAEVAVSCSLRVQARRRVGLERLVVRLEHFGHRLHAELRAFSPFEPWPSRVQQRLVVAAVERPAHDAAVLVDLREEQQRAGDDPWRVCVPIRARSKGALDRRLPRDPRPGCRRRAARATGTWPAVPARAR